MMSDGELCRAIDRAVRFLKQCVLEDREAQWSLAVLDGQVFVEAVRGDDESASIWQYEVGQEGTRLVQAEGVFAGGKPVT